MKLLPLLFMKAILSNIGTFMGIFVNLYHECKRHRYNMYTSTKPHEGFKMLLEMGEKLKKGNYFAYTSNVDGHFQKAGFPEAKVVECHGSLNHCQCDKCYKIFPVPMSKIPIDYENCIATTLPQCPTCKCLVRPNVLMFGDYGWMGERTAEQVQNFSYFLQDNTYFLYMIFIRSNVIRNTYFCNIYVV